MTNFSNPACVEPVLNREIIQGKPFYAVYDSCGSGNVPGFDLAFIEERAGSFEAHKSVIADEQYFTSLPDAKAYVRAHFQSGAEYFSIKQLGNPDNLLYEIIDRITYLIA